MNIKSIWLVTLLSACATGPKPADVVADRDRWTAIRDVAKDGQISSNESELLSQLLEAWDEKLAFDEAHVASADTTVQDLIRVYGLASAQIFLAPELQKRAPDVFRLIDRNNDGTLDETELLSVDPKSPVFAVVVISTAARLLARR